MLVLAFVPLKAFAATPVAVDDSYSTPQDTALNVGDAWWDNNWTRRTKLTFNNSGQTATLPDFPVLVTLDSSRVDYTQIQNAGQDLRFIDDNGVTVLAHEIEEWNEAGTSYVWVKVPLIDGLSSSDHVWLYYANASAPDGQNANAVWSNGYLGVWHLNEDPTGPQITDSTANAQNGTAGGGMTPSDQVPGQIGGSLDFDGNDDRVDLDDIDLIQDLTIEAWVNPSAYNSWMRIVAKGWTSNVDPWTVYDLILNASNPRIAFLDISTGGGVKAGVITSSTVGLNTWSYLAGTYDGTTQKIYFNGTLEGTNATPSGPLDQNDVPTFIAYNSTDPSGMNFEGKIDEVRISNVSRSSDWVAAQHLSMTDAFITFDETQGILDNDSDADGDPLYAVLQSGPSSAQSFTLYSDGSFSYTPNLGFIGVDTFTYTANDGIANSNTATVTIAVGVIDLSLTKAVDNATPAVGTNVMFTLTAANAAGMNNATGVVVTDALPTGYSYVTDDGAGAYVPATGVWTIGNLNAGTNAVLNITAQVLGAGVYTNTAEVTAANEPDLDSTPGNGAEDDFDSATTTPVSAACPGPSTEFSDGFESGIPGLWDSFFEDGADDSISTSTTQVFTGTFSAEASVGSTPNPQAFVWKDPTPRTKYYGRTYLFLPASFAVSDEWAGMLFIETNGGWQNIISLTVDSDMSLMMYNDVVY